MQRIKLPEHYSSRLLFVDDKNIPDSLNFKLEIEDTTSGQIGHDEMDNSEYPNNFLLGKLTNNIWYLEDSGIYDSNHEHTAEIYNENNGVRNTLYNVTRIMEYGSECDRLYMEHGGGLKVILLDSPSTDLKANFYIKYERSLPAAKEYYGTLQNNSTGQNIYNCLAFLKANNSISEAIQITIGLTVTKEDLDEYGNAINMDNIYYCNIIPKQVDYNFSKISITYNIDPNLSNEPKISMIGTKSIGSNIGYGNYYGKFVSYKYAQQNDSYVEPGYFIVQAPKNRSWICYRTCYNRSYFGVTEINYTTGLDKIKNNCKCTNIRWEGAGMNGYYGTFDNGKYYYNINIDRSKLPFILYLPHMFCDYLSISYLNSSNNEVTIYDGEPIEDIYNELDGMFYKVIIIGPNSSIYKIKLEYSAS